MFAKSSALFAEYVFDWEAFRFQAIAEYVPTVLAAVAVLILGWIIALVVSFLVKKAVDKSGLDNKLAKSFADDEAQAPKVTQRIGTVVFWLLMLFVFVAFLHTLGLPNVAEPINSFLNQVFAYAPRILAALLLVFLAWLSATVLRFIVRKGCETARLDERLSREAEAEAEVDTKQKSKVVAKSDEPKKVKHDLGLTTTLSDATYWLVWLLFLPAILDALGLGGILAPVQNMVNEVLGYLPNLLAAAAILIVGWFGARILRRLVTNISHAVGADDLSQRVGMTNVIGQQRLSDVLGTVVYVLVLIPIIIAALHALNVEAVTAPATAMLATILDALPRIFAAIVIIALAYVVARLVSELVSSVLSKVGFDEVPSKLGIAKKNVKVDGRTPSDIVGIVVLVAILLVAAMQAMWVMEFPTVAALIAQFLEFGGHVLLGLIIFAFGLYAAIFVSGLVKDSDLNQSDVLSWVAYVGILVLASAMALQEMGLASSIVNLAFGLTLGAIAVAAAIAFGIGGQDAAKDLIDKVRATKNTGPGRKKDS